MHTLFFYCHFNYNHHCMNTATMMRKESGLTSLVFTQTLLNIQPYIVISNNGYI